MCFHFVAEPSCGTDEYQCRNGDCIPSSFECNGHADCVDASDEGNKLYKYIP